MVIGLIACLPLHYGATLLAGGSHWPRRYLRWVGWAAGLRVQTAGTPLHRDVLIVANHLSWLDILVLGGSGGAAFVSKAELRDTPVLGWLASLNQTLFVERTDRRGVHIQAGSLREGLASGRAFGLFPEGTTGPGWPLLPFRPSLLASLFPALPRTRVQPVAIDYGPAAQEVAWTDPETGLANAKRLLARPGTVPVTLRFLEPIDPHAAGDRKVLANRARDEIIAALGASAARTDRL